MSRARRAPPGQSGPPEPLYESAADAPAARERVLRAAYELFRAHGVAATGVDRIVTDAGVAKTTLYRHFHSKDELVVAVLERHEEVWLGWLQAEVERRGSTPGERLLAIFDAFDDWFSQSAYRGCLFTNTLLEAHGSPALMGTSATEKLADVRAFVRRLAQEAGVADPKEFALQLQMIMLGSIAAALEGHRDAARRGRAVAELLLARA